MDMDRSRASQELLADIAALRTATEKGLPNLAATERALRSSSLPHSSPVLEGTMMKMLTPFRSRPRFVTTVAGSALAVAVLLWPVSYERTIGQTVTIHIPMSAAAPLDQAAQMKLARQMKQSLRAQSVQLRRRVGQGGELTLVATVPMRSTQQATQQTQKLVDKLREEHVVAQAEVVARTVKTAGRVYAMALDKLISVRVETAGRSDSQVEGEIRDQLEASGIPSPTVSFERHGDESQLQIAADVDGRSVQIQRQAKGGPDTLELSIGGIDDTRDSGMTDAQLKDKIERLLRARGFEPTVTVSGDHVGIRAEHHLAAP
jgi:hypothetical protein